MSGRLDAGGRPADPASREQPTTPDDLERLEALFHATVGLDAGARRAYLDAACGPETALRREIEALLAADRRDDSFLDSPASAALALRAVAEAADDESVTAAQDGAIVDGADAGRQVGAYRLLRLLGQGGMGRVYLAERDDIDRQVAVKLLHGGVATPDAVRRFLRERKLLARVDHPNIARLLDAGVLPDGAPYFAMDLVDGEPVTAYAAHLPTLEARMRVFAAVCGAVAYAHQHLIVHRDLKPSNILVDRSGEVKLLDFGIAKLLEEDEDDSGLRRTGIRVMTPEYAAPEQVRGEPITPATDVYALGLLLHELLTGARPYTLRGLTPSEAERRLREWSPTRPSASAPAQRPVPEDLDAICLKALDGAAARRYPTAAELRADVGRWLARRPVEARVPTSWYHARKFVARHRLPVAAAAVLALLLVGGVVAIWSQVYRADRERTRAEQALAEAVAVGDFLMGLFEAPDPAVARGAEPPVRDLLERGARRADQLTAQPLLQARMLDTIGRVYQSLGQYDKAEPLLRRALSTRQQQHPGEHPETAASLHSLAHFLHVRGTFEEAEQRYREALEMRRRVLQAPHPEIAETLARYGVFRLRVRNDQTGAETLFRESLAMRQAALGDRHPKVASALRELGGVFTARKDFAGAERHYRAALAIHRAELGPTHPETIVTLNNLGTALAASGDSESAERTFREVLEANRRVLGNDHPGIAVNLNNLATVLQRRQQPHEAEALYREALAINERSLGAGHPNVAWVAANLARAVADRGRFAEAEALYRRADDIYTSQLPPGHNARRELHGRMASLYRAWKKEDLATRFEALASPRAPASSAAAAAAQPSPAR